MPSKASRCPRRREGRAGVGQQPPAGRRRDELPPTHLDEPGDGSIRSQHDRVDRVGRRRSRRLTAHHVSGQPHHPPHEMRTDRLGSCGEPAQPPAHRRPRRPAQHRDRSLTPPGRTRQQRRADHLDQITPPQQHRRRQQHVRRPARSTPAAARTDPHTTITAADHPRTRPRPRRQPPTTRTRQRAHRQLRLDLHRIRAYRKHRFTSKRQKPSRVRQDIAGGLRSSGTPRPCRTHDHMTNQATPRLPSSHPMTPYGPVMLISGVALQGGDAHSCWRLRHLGRCGVLDCQVTLV